MKSMKNVLKIVIVLLMLVSNTVQASAATYRYDELGRLIEVIDDNDNKVTYTYDAGGNILTVTTTSSTSSISDILLDTETYNLAVEEKRSIKVIAKYADGGQLDVTTKAAFKSSDISIATIDSSGVITGVSLGQTTVTANYMGKTVKAIVLVGTPELQFKYFNTDSVYIFNGATDSAVDSNGNVYISDFNNNCIVQFDSRGKFINKYGSLGSGVGKFNKPSGLSIDESDNIYIADSNNNRIVRFKDTNSNGKIDDSEWQAYGGVVGSGVLQFKKPMGITVKGTRVFVADTYNSRITMFKVGSSDIEWSTLGSYGDGNGQFKYPYDVTIDQEGNIWVSDTFNNRVQKFGSNGQYINNFSANLPYGISCGTDGKVFVAERQTAFIKCINDPIVYGGKGKTEGLYTSPVGVNVDSSGSVWIIDVTANKIQHSVLVYSY